MRPVLLLEINEVPERVWRKYASDHRYPSISRVVKESRLVKTKISDEGELSPWCTWPTLHRGLSKKDHGIFNLGQDPSTFRGVPIWEEFRNRGMPVGVFGSLQSWPPMQPGAGGFYVPDTFSQDERCIPSYLEPVQSFNLAQVKANARVMKDRAMDRSPGFKLLVAMLRSGVTVKTLMRIALQLFSERMQPSLKERRVSFQAILFWDIFRAHFKASNPPAFTTFFTNHIASVMHRYWNHIFPQDFPDSTRPKDSDHSKTMDFAMSVLDRLLEDALAWRRINPELLLLVANSMGQTAVLRKAHEGYELLLRSPLRLLRQLGYSGEVKENIAMMPQVALEFASGPQAEAIAAKLVTITTLAGNSFIRCDLRGTTLSLTIATPPAAEVQSGVFLLDGKEELLEQCGFEKAKVDAGTAYHVPEGLILVHGLPESADSPTEIPTEKAKALIMSWAGIS